MESVKATDLLTDNYLRYGAYVNNGRSTVGIDGLKNVERRVLLGVRDVASTKLQRSSLVCGHTLGNYHPHGDCYGTLVKLVHDGFVLGHGNFGDHLSSPAAMRYTSVKANQEFNEAVFKFIDFVPTQDSEFGVKEPLRLPVPLPLCLTSGGMGIGVGLSMNIPAFSPMSLYRAMLKDDPTLLAAPKGLTLVDADYERLWETGDGSVQYGMRVYQEKSENDDNRQVSVITGSPRLFVPNVERIFREELEDELVYIRDESVDDFRVIISRVKGIKRIDDSEVHAKAQQAATKMVFTRLFVSDGTSARKVGLRWWLNECWSNYKDSFHAYQKDRVERLEYRIHLYELIPKVYPLLLQNMATKAIAGSLNERMETIKDIEARPMRLLRKNDFDEEIKNLRRDVRAVKKLTPEELGERFIETLNEK